MFKKFSIGLVSLLLMSNLAIARDTGGLGKEFHKESIKLDTYCKFFDKDENVVNAFPGYKVISMSHNINSDGWGHFVMYSSTDDKLIEASINRVQQVACVYGIWNNIDFNTETIQEMDEYFQSQKEEPKPNIVLPK
jgi:hypothetical protein